ncbi:phage tail protein [Variovorax paradoxus]|uniref:phage tail protein n=1 Tax=Variovorax paradoxus TaxID=34073 RepID=UPI002480297A|nr:phage tail protein [Variovorax paradoxus]WGT64805.1 phage tail protein [Variovorax paradoxus]
MAVTTTLAACNTNPALNGPDGSDLPATLDDAIRYALSFIAQLRDGAGMPVGAIVPFSGATAGLGYVIGNGSLLSRTTYAALFAYASAAGLVSEAAWTAGSFGSYSVGDGSTTFRVPDFRGMFLRGLDQSRGVDPGRVLGSYQLASNAPHVHGVADPTHVHPDPGHAHQGSTLAAGDHAHGYTGSTPSGAGAFSGGTTVYAQIGAATGVAGSHAHTIQTDVRGTGLLATATNISIQSQGIEGRPSNLAYPFCIKY